MTMESDLTTLLKTICTRTFTDTAPVSTVRPYITFQGIGGKSLRYTENTANLRHTRMQINVWSKTRVEALSLIRLVEDAMCAATVFTATPDGEPMNTKDDDMDLYGCHQDFNVWSAR